MCRCVLLKTCFKCFLLLLLPCNSSRFAQRAAVAALRTCVAVGVQRGSVEGEGRRVRVVWEELGDGPASVARRPARRRRSGGGAHAGRLDRGHWHLFEREEPVSWRRALAREVRNLAKVGARRACRRPGVRSVRVERIERMTLMQRDLQLWMFEQVLHARGERSRRVQERQDVGGTDGRHVVGLLRNVVSMLQNRHRLVGNRVDRA